MKKMLRTALLALAAGICFSLLALGSVLAIMLFFGGIFLFFGFSFSGEIPVILFNIFGLATVGICSFACFTGLSYLINLCRNAIHEDCIAIAKPLLFASLSSIAATISIFLHSSVYWFLPACIFADVVHIIYIIVYVHDRSRRKDLCDTSSSSSSDSPQSLPTSGS